MGTIQYTDLTESDLPAATSEITSRNQKKLDKLIAERKGKVEYTNSLVRSVLEESERTVVNEMFITKPGQFVYTNSKPVKVGELYHIHYTKRLAEFYMTGYEHNENSKIIFNLGARSSFSHYNTLNKQSVLTIEETRVLPKESDYKNGYYTRYFAKKANDVSVAPFEIKSEDYDKSPLYNYVSLNWVLRGPKLIVKIKNIQEIKKNKKIILNLDKFLPIYQYYRIVENLTPKKLIQNKLGISTTSTVLTETSETIESTINLH